MKTILFDLDGTLTDSGEGIMNCGEYALSHFGITPPPRVQMRTMVGPPLTESFLRFGVPEDQVDEAIRIYRSRYIPIGKFENFPYPGIEQLLEKLTADGHKLYVTTSKPEQMSIEILEHFGLAKYFTRICGAATDRSRNSKEAVIAYLLAECATEGPVLMVGDTAFDVIGAKAHGIPTVGVSWGYGEISDMEAAGAISIAYTMDELYEQLTK
jgi:phosphoglycolate phosphatase